MTVRQTAKVLAKSAKSIIKDYLRVKCYLLGGFPKDCASTIADEVAPRFAELILDNEIIHEEGLRENVFNEVKYLILKCLSEEGSMVTERKIRANSENARHGGVKTTEGKNISKNNSLKHSILAQGSIPSDLISLEDIYRQLHEEFKPDTPSRDFLVQQLSLTVIRLARCSRLEAEIFEEQSTWSWDISTVLDRLGTLGERYEGRLVGRMLRLIDALKVK